MRLKKPYVLALSAIVGATVYIACGNDPTVYEPPEAPTIDKGHIYTWAGTGLPGAGAAGQEPNKTNLYWPADVCFDDAGNIYVLDYNNHRVLDLDAGGKFRIVVGCVPGPGCILPGDAPNGQGNATPLNHPTHVAFDSNGDLILAAWHNSLMKRLDLTTGAITTFCGNGGRGFNGDGVTAANAVIDLPACVVYGPDGDLYFTDQANMRIRKIDGTTGTVETVVGSGPVHTDVFAGDGGPATSARLALGWGQNAVPAGKFCFDAAGDMYIADTENHCIRVVRQSNGFIYSLAGKGDEGGGYSGDGGAATAAKLNLPRDVALDSDGNLYIADTGNFCVRKVDTSGIITTVAGTPGVFGKDTTDGLVATKAKLSGVTGVEIGPDGRLWIADFHNNLIRFVPLK